MHSLIFHVDVNSAFLSWESAKRLRDNPDALDLRTINAVIGGDEKMRHGVVLAKSPSAKKYGIMTGEPLSHARQKCPELVVVPPDHELYAASSRKFIGILEEVAPVIEQCSIDEAFCDMTGTEKLYGDPIAFATKLKDRIYKELGFTVNIGISTNKLLAKMAGELEKPNKCITLFPEEIETKFWPLPIEDLFMVGRRTAPRLRKMGIRTVGELAAYPPLLLEKEFKSFGKLLHAYANGIDDSPVAPSVSESKSIGNSTTTPFDVTDREAAYKILLALSETVSMRLRQEKLCAEEIAVTLKTANFQVYSHQKQLPNAIAGTNAVYAAAAEIFDEVWKGEPLRLLGVRAGKLCKEDCIQLSLLEQDWSKQKKADAAMDAIRKKYGKNSICRSTFLGEKNTFQKE